jgi:hypothetical protein
MPNLPFDLISRQNWLKTPGTPDTPVGGGNIPVTPPGVPGESGFSNDAAEYGQCKFFTIPFVAGTMSQLLRQKENRVYMFILNKSVTDSLFIGFGLQANEGNGFIIPPTGFYEPYKVPIDDIFVAASANNTSLLFVYGLID